MSQKQRANHRHKPVDRKVHPKAGRRKGAKRSQWMRTYQ